jgi:hypothetical protein
MATFFHDLQIGETERLYFRYTGGQPAAITEAEYQRAVGSGLNARLTVYPPGSTLSSAFAGGGWYDTATRVITASYSGSNLMQLGGQGSGMMSWGDTGLSVTLRIGTTGVPGTDTGGDSGSTGGAVQSPAAPILPPIPPLPTGNGNSGFQSSGPVGSQIGITGGNS